MPIVPILVTLIVIGVLWWAVNSILAPYLQPPIGTIINVVIVVLVLFWLLNIFFGAAMWQWGPVIGRVR